MRHRAADIMVALRSVILCPVFVGRGRMLMYSLDPDSPFQVLFMVVRGDGGRGGWSERGSWSRGGEVEVARFITHAFHESPRELWMKVVTSKNSSQSLSTATYTHHII